MYGLDVIYLLLIGRNSWEICSLFLFFYPSRVSTDETQAQASSGRRSAQDHPDEDVRRQAKRSYPKTATGRQGECGHCRLELEFSADIFTNGYNFSP